MPTPTAYTARPRVTYALLLGSVLGAGLLWRSGWLPLSPFWFKYGGDSLWALAVFLGFGTIWRMASTTRVACLALAFSFAVEFSQLCHAPWLEAIRGNMLGRLVLGSTFNAPDLLAYVAGIGAAMAGEFMWRRK